MAREGYGERYIGRPGGEDCEALWALKGLDLYGVVGVGFGLLIGGVFVDVGLRDSLPGVGVGRRGGGLLIGTGGGGAGSRGDKKHA
ncbi:hypothetical protein DV096_14325 [Bradymonadaceae bacterium TMQ3]|nr:hypothetical protein DV096_14325 [Bradymonadaceae bacterium TMQ3]